MQQTQILHRGETFALENSPVEGFPVKADKKSFSIDTIFVKADSTTCPNCTKMAVSYDEILCDFGLRNMGDGTIRVQSWCKECRKNSAKGVVV
jgi:hypothetical protein